MQIGKCYNCTFWVSLGNPCGLATNNVSMWLTKTAHYSDTIADPLGLAIIPANPQIYNYGNPVIKDTQNWVKVSSIYVAHGEEQFITIGNFKNDANTVFVNVGPNTAGQTAYYVDDVSIIPLDSLPLKADAAQDATIALGDSVFIGSLTNGITNITWYNSSGAVINTTAPGLYVRPTVSTFYVVEQTVCGYYSRDTVYVNVGAMPLQLLSFTTNTNKNKTVGLYWQTANEFNVSHFNIQRSYRGTNAFENIGTVTANNKPYNTYTYHYNATFSTTTPNAKPKTILFRLQTVDKDGSINYSKVVKVIMNDKESIEVFPNPASNFIIVKGGNRQQVELMNSVGTTVYSQKINSGYIQIPLTGLSPGVYIVKVTNSNNAVIIKKVIRN